MAKQIDYNLNRLTSISGSLIKYYKVDNKILNENNFDENTFKNTVKGIEVIKEQVGDLMEFVQSYRSF